MNGVLVISGKKNHGLNIKSLYVATAEGPQDLLTYSAGFGAQGFRNTSKPILILSRVN